MQTINNERFTILDYCQYLISSQINYTFTNLAEHLQKWSDDTIRRRLNKERITGRIVWESVKNHIEKMMKPLYLLMILSWIKTIRRKWNLSTTNIVAQNIG